jgi:hypothetical protein
MEQIMVNITIASPIKLAIAILYKVALVVSLPPKTTTSGAEVAMVWLALFSKFISSVACNLYP